MKRRMFAQKGTSLSGAEKERQAKDKNEAVARTLRESIACMHAQNARLLPARAHAAHRQSESEGTRANSSESDGC